MQAYVVARDLGKSFGPKCVLRDLDFTVEPGDVVGVLGKNGAGKTTLLEIMLGFSPASHGRVSVFGQESFALSAASKVRIGFVPQQDELLAPLTARDQVATVAAFYPNWDAPLIERLCNAWELDLDERIQSMSVGQRQKLSILLAMGHRPDLLVLDEPVASLDPIARRRFLEQIVEVTAEADRAVVFSSHIVSDVERLASRIWIVQDGALRWQGGLDALKESVVRIRIRNAGAAEALPFRALHVTRSAGHLSAVVDDWSEARHAALCSQFGEAIEVEPLSLEDIFLALHR
ncbi:MAG TPA: ABC transporter ATP-binding protein [Povalibacter sp.]|uniref:ABC transporter ATP-binding protein n=1 Tax=Povalibacter sp. TaxID=1962978 RepID=UPI002CED0FC1|nr:ABC transporter ATP-binding protein [Povalibacter sp.]HMN43517.1 ABC transporter ATP-binding protein [Povalibacter sp.]